MKHDIALSQDPDAVRVAEIWERFQEHIHLHGALVKNDKQLWRWVDQMSEQTFVDLYTFAREHQDWDVACETWLERVEERTPPFYVRLKAEHNRQCDNNRFMWKMMMMFREIVQARLQEEARPFNKLFEMDSL